MQHDFLPRFHEFSGVDTSTRFLIVGAKFDAINSQRRKAPAKNIFSAHIDMILYVLFERCSVNAFENGTLVRPAISAVNWSGMESQTIEWSQWESLLNWIHD